MRTAALALASLLALAGVVSAAPPNPAYVGTVTVGATNTTVTFTDNHSGGTGLAFLARNIVVMSRATSANTCYLDYEDGTATTSDIPLAPGQVWRKARSFGTTPESGWASMGVICAGGQSATFDITADRFGEVVPAIVPTSGTADYFGFGRHTFERSLFSYGLGYMGPAADWVDAQNLPGQFTLGAKVDFSARIAYPSFASQLISVSATGTVDSGVGYGTLMGQQIYVADQTTNTADHPMYTQGSYLVASAASGTHNWLIQGANASVLLSNGSTVDGTYLGDAVGGVFGIAAHATAAFSSAIGLMANSPEECDSAYTPPCASASKVYSLYARGIGRNVFDSVGNTSNYTLETTDGKGALLSGKAGQLQLAKEAGGAKPTCDAAHRGSLWYEPGSAGVADTLEACKKDAANAYAWVTLW